MNTDTPQRRAALAVEGFTQAKARYIDLTKTPGATEVEVVIPLIEALWWARSADEEFTNTDLTGYEKRRDADPDGSVMNGIRYIRNRCGHQRALAVVDSEATFPVRLPVILGRQFRWKNTDQLPPADRKSQEFGKDVYEKRMAGDAAVQTLDRVSAWFGRQAISSTP